jgi:hypothetical protein
MLQRISPEGVQLEKQLFKLGEVDAIRLAR